VKRNYVTWPQVTRSVPEVMSFERNSPASGCGRPKTGVYCTFHFLQCTSQEEAVTWQEMTSRDLRSPEVTLEWRHLNGSHLEVPVEGRKAEYSIHFTSYKAVDAGGGSHVTGNAVTWPQVTGNVPKVKSFEWKSPGSGCRRPKTGVYCTFHFLQGCSSQEEAVTWQEMTSHDLWWPEVTRKLRHLTGSHLEVAV